MAVCCEVRWLRATALAIFDAAQAISPLDETSKMRRASSLIRAGKVREGNVEYRRLIADFPNNVGMRRSHVDALLYREEFRQAHSAPKEHDLQPEKHVWHARQSGRAELGLHNYPRAIEIFRQLRERRAEDPIIVTWLARSLQQFGDLNGAIEVLRTGVHQQLACHCYAACQSDRAHLRDFPITSPKRRSATSRMIYAEFAAGRCYSGRTGFSVSAQVASTTGYRSASASTMRSPS